MAEQDETPLRCPWCDANARTKEGHLIVDGKVTGCPVIGLMVVMNPPPSDTIR